MYSNVDAALRWLQEFTNFLVSECSVQVCVDPYILYQSKNGVLKIVKTIHVDDLLCSGSK